MVKIRKIIFLKENCENCTARGGGKQVVGLRLAVICPWNGEISTGRGEGDRF